MNEEGIRKAVEDAKSFHLLSQLLGRVCSETLKTLSVHPDHELVRGLGVAMLGLSDETVHHLQQTGLGAIGSLLDLSERDLFLTLSISGKVRKEILVALEHHGFTLKKGKD